MKLRAYGALNVLTGEGYALLSPSVVIGLEEVNVYEEDSRAEYTLRAPYAEHWSGEHQLGRIATR